MIAPHCIENSVTARATYARRILTLALLLSALGAVPGLTSVARAERPTTSDVYSYLAQAGQIVFNNSGGAFLPISVLQAMKNGQVSPILQFVLVNNLMTQCIQSTVTSDRIPAIRDPYVVAKAKFDYGICRITQCFKQGMLMLVLPQLAGTSSSSGTGTSGSTSNPIGAALANGFKQQQGCDGSGDSGLDPLLLSLLVGQ